MVIVHADNIEQAKDPFSLSTDGGYMVGTREVWGNNCCRTLRNAQGVGTRLSPVYLCQWSGISQWPCVISGYLHPKWLLCSQEWCSCYWELFLHSSPLTSKCKYMVISMKRMPTTPTSLILLNGTPLVDPLITTLWFLYHCDTDW